MNRRGAFVDRGSARGAFASQSFCHQAPGPPALADAVRVHWGKGFEHHVKTEAAPPAAAAAAGGMIDLVGSRDSADEGF